ncbi:MAG: hypothetical protein QOH46_3170, partial [Solirubrobacteraceae bacterium]|nr:hypothetical protein [Solirubrobacteraceae bacterium]
MLFERGRATRSRRETMRAKPARLRAWAGRRTGLGFGARLTVTLAVTLGLVGALGYVKISGVLERRVIEQDAVYQRARAEAPEAVAREQDKRAVHAEIADV